MKNKKYIFIIIAFIILFTGIFGPYIRNNILLEKFANQLYTIPLPPSTIQISQDKAVGNLYWTGNHLDFLATIEIESSLSETELSQYYLAKSIIKSANEVSFMKLDTRYPDPVDVDRPRIVNIEVIPKAKAIRAYSKSKLFYKTDFIDNDIDDNLFIIQIKDTHYAPGWDIRAH